MLSRDSSHTRTTLDPGPEVNDVLAAASERNHLTAAIGRLEADIAKLRQALSQAEDERNALVSSTSWRLTSPLRKMVGLARRWRPSTGSASPDSPAPLLTPPVSLSSIDTETGHARLDPDYEDWVREYDSLTEQDRAAIRRAIARFSRTPRFSLILPLTAVDEQSFWIMLGTIEAQLYDGWELCIVAGSASAFDSVARLRRGTTKSGRIRWIAGPETSDVGRLINAGLAQAQGDFAILLPSQGRLAEDALFEMADTLQTAPDLDFIFTDEDWMDDNGQRLLPHFKPDWNIDLALGHDMAGHLVAYRCRALTGIGGAQVGLTGGQGYDLSLRMAAATASERIRHIPRILFHRLYEEDGASHFSSWAMSEALATDRAIARNFLAGAGHTKTTVIASAHTPLTTRIVWPLPDPAPLVTLIVPTRDHLDLIARCVAGLLHRTDYPAIELLIVDHDSQDPETLAFLAHLEGKEDRVRILRISGPFNYPAINNRAVREARGEVIVLINNDIDVIGPGWLREMVSHALRPDIGAVGAKLLYQDGQIQHAGVVLGVGSHAGGPGVAGHFGRGADRRDIGYFGQYTVAREVSAVTGACMALRREVYEAVGGLDESNLPISFNDVDLCLRIREQGWRIVWTPFAELYHLESRSRGADTTPEQIERAAREADYMRARWGHVLDHDPFYNANFDRRDHNFRLRPGSFIRGRRSVGQPGADLSGAAEPAAGAHDDARSFSSLTNATAGR